jgi:hypothetical protein
MYRVRDCRPTCKLSSAASAVFDGEDRTAASNSRLLSGQAGKRRLVLRSGSHDFFQASRLFWKELFSLYCPLRSWIWETILVNNKIAHDDFVSSVEAG